MYEQKKELFESYEIKSWEVTPRLYKIFGASILLNLMFVFVAAQTDLTQKGCDTPFGSGICQVLNTVYIGSTMLGTDSEYVSKEYVKNELEDADITYIDVSSETPPLTYPEGYFAIANPNDFAAMQTSDFSTMPTDMSGFPMSPPVSNGVDLMNTPQVVPTPNNDAVAGTIPDSPFSFGNENPIAKTPPPYRSPKVRNYNTKIPKIKNESPKTLPSNDELAGKTKDKETKDKEIKEKTEEVQPNKNQPPVAIDAVAAIEINKKPFEDLGDALIDKLEKKEIDLSKPFSVVLDGTLTADGKLDPKKSKFGKSTGDEEMISMAKMALESVGNSGILSYLKMNGVDKVNFTLVQDEEQIYAIIVSDQKTPEKAKTIVSSLNMALQGLKFADNNGLKKLDENSKTLVSNSKVTSQGNSFVLNFAIPKTVGQDLINRSLKERTEKKNSQPSSEVGQASKLNATK
jgi:hypothetical protein